VRRETYLNTRLVDFTDTSNLTEADLDKSALQLFFLLQEATDKITAIQADQLWGGTYPGLSPEDIASGVNFFFSQQGLTLDNIPDGETYVRVNSAALDANGLVLLSMATGTTDSLVEGINNKWFSGKTLDDLPQGTFFKKVNASALDANGLVLLSMTSGTTDDLDEGVAHKWFSGKTLDDLPQGTFFKKVNASALDANGLVLISAASDVANGTYGLLASTYVQAGKIKVTSGTNPFDASIPENLTVADKTSTVINGGLVSTGYIVSSDGNYLIAFGCKLKSTAMDQRYTTSAHFDVDAQYHQYIWDNNTWIEIANVGKSTMGSDNVAVLCGTYANDAGGALIGVFGRSYANHAIHGTTYNGPGWAGVAGVVGNNLHSSAGYGVYGNHQGGGTGVRAFASSGGTGLYAEGGHIGALVKGNTLGAGGSLVIVASAASGVPTHVASVGTIVQNSNGTTYMNVNGSTTWQLINKT